MTNKEYKDFMKRYEKFRKNNLPTLFWDEERQTWEYVYRETNTNNPNRNIYLNISEEDKDLKFWNIQNSIFESLSGIAFTGLYYPFNCEGEHEHNHSFEDVVRALYEYPETFEIAPEDEKYYSKQELNFLHETQKYLQFIGLTDVKRNKNNKVPVSRYRNSRQKKYGNCYIHTWNDSAISDIIKGKRDFVVGEYSEFYDQYGPETWEPNEHRCLIVDKDYNFRLFVDFVKEEVCEYSKIKNIVQLDKYKDTDKVVLTYIKVLEVF